jgi:hypothetical protein
MSGAHPAMKKDREKQARFGLARTGTALAMTSAVANPGSKHLSETKTTSTLARPVCDEWGFYDPEQAGFEALVRRLLPDEDEAQRSKASPLPLTAVGAAR